MVKVTLLGREFDVAPYKLGALKQAAPFVDRVNAKAGALTTLEGALDVAADLVGFVQIGLAKVDPALTVESMLDEIGYDEMPALQVAFRDILQASGLKPKGEAPAPVVADQPAASTISSAE